VISSGAPEHAAANLSERELAVLTLLAAACTTRRSRNSWHRRPPCRTPTGNNPMIYPLRALV